MNTGNDLFNLENKYPKSSHQSSDSSCCRGNSGNDLASDAFGLESVGWLDGIHSGSQSRRRCNKVHVAVAIIVLLELQWAHLQPLCTRKANNYQEIFKATTAAVTLA